MPIKFRWPSNINGFRINSVLTWSQSTNSDLPAEYQRVKGFKFSSNTYYKITNFHLRGSDSISFTFSVNKACNVLGCYISATADDNYSLYISSSAGAKYLRYDGVTYDSYFSSTNFGKKFKVVISPTGTQGLPIDSQITPSDFESNVDFCIGTTAENATSSKFDGNLEGNIIVKNRLKLIPCERISDGVLGYYDTYTQNFYEPIGSAPISLGYII